VDGVSTTILFEDVVLVVLTDRENGAPAPVDSPSSSSRQQAAGDGGLQQLNRAHRGLASADGVKSMLSRDTVNINSR